MHLTLPKTFSVEGMVEKLLDHVEQWAKIKIMVGDGGQILGGMEVKYWGGWRSNIGGDGGQILGGMHPPIPLSICSPEQKCYKGVTWCNKNVIRVLQGCNMYFIKIFM